MNKEVTKFSQPPVHSNLRSSAMTAYILYAVAFMLVITLIIGIFIAYQKRKEAVDSIYYSHFQYLIKTFWVALLGFVIGGVAMFVGIGGLIFLTVSVWFIYRVVAGFIKLNSRQVVSTDSWF